MSILKIEIESAEVLALVADLHIFSASPWIEEAQSSASDDVYDFVKKWYREGGRELFLNPKLPTHGAGRASTRWFERSVLQAWETRNVTQEGFEIVNDDASFALKVTGGAITAKNARALTIPVTPEAHGKRVAEYNSTVAQLFKPKNKNYLARLVEDRIEPVYLLRKSVHIKANSSLIPREDELSTTYEDSLNSTLESELNDLFY